MYFDTCNTTDEIRRRYRELAMHHHPDHGGSTRIMQDINAAYAFASAHTRQHEKPGRSQAEYTDMANVDERIRAALEALAGLQGLAIEICGLWVWVSGETRTHKETLKAAGYHWAPKKQRWYFAGVESSGRGAYSMDDIRDRYGSKQYQEAA